MKTPNYESTVARIAGNLLSGNPYLFGDDNARLVTAAVQVARMIITEVQRTAPREEAVHAENV